MLYNIPVSKEKVIIFTDGASKGNPGPGGWGAVVSMGDTVTELGAGYRKTTNNEMELIALLRSLEILDEQDSDVHVYLDSKYVLNGVTKWLSGWKKNNWQTKAKKPVMHQQLWEKIGVLLEKHRLTLEYVPGHAGIPGNERVDDIAQEFATAQEPVLFSGDKKEYSVDLSDVEKKQAGASDKKKRSKGKAYSYVSRVDGVVETHQSWAECEKRVKGAKGARFKKAFSESEEKNLINEYTRSAE